MQTDPQLHHIAKRITAGSLEKVIEVFELLGCELFYREDGARWAMVGQHAVPNFDIQFVEVAEPPRSDEQKINSHVAFISHDPAAQLANIERWAADNEIAFVRGGWNEQEVWFDLPELFVDFVVEVMHVSVTENPVKQ